MANGNDKLRNGGTLVGAATRQRSIAHPRFNMKQAEEFAKIVYRAGARHCDVDVIAKKAGFSQARNGSFVALRSSATQFGMVIGDGQTVSVSEDWIDLILHDDPTQLRIARQRAMYKPGLYKQILEDYVSKQLPTVEKLTQQLFLNSKYGIIKEAASVAAKTFFESASYAGIINEKGFIQPPVQPTSTATDIDIPDADNLEDAEGPDRSAVQGKVQDLKERVQLLAPQDELAGLFKSAIPLENETVVYIYAPRRLTRRDKERLKMYIELMLDEPDGGDRSSGGRGLSPDESDDDK